MVFYEIIGLCVVTGLVLLGVKKYMEIQGKKVAEDITGDSDGTAETRDISGDKPTRV